MNQQKGFKQLSFSLKIVFILSIFWILGSIIGISMRYELGIPFMGSYIYGLFAVLVVLILDIIGPIAFVCGMYHRFSWAPNVAYFYMGIFILNSFIAIFLFRNQLGVEAVTIPGLVTLIFLIIVYKNRYYFK